MKKTFITLFLIVSSTFYGVDINPAKHAHNKRLLKAILDEEDAATLTTKVNEIASALLKRGFQPEAYTVPEGAALVFDCFPLWEGESIPFTVFVYVWPSKTETNIHSHPIPCAFSVLQGTLTQRNYALVSPTQKTVRLLHEDPFPVGKGEIDDLKQPFIHQLYNNQATPCLSLHIYGLGTSEKVMNCFRETFSEHSYRFKALE